MRRLYNAILIAVLSIILGVGLAWSTGAWQFRAMRSDGSYQYTRLLGGTNVTVTDDGNATGLRTITFDTATPVLPSDLNILPPDSQRIFRSRLTSGIIAFQTISDRAYFVYVGRTTVAITPKQVRLWVAAGGTGAQTAELGLFSTPAAPNGGGQVLTKLVATGTIGDCTGTGLITNTAAFATSISAGTYLWAGCRFALATTQPQTLNLNNGWTMGEDLLTSTAGALTAAGPWTGALITHATTGECPDLRVTMD